MIDNPLAKLLELQPRMRVDLEWSGHTNFPRQTWVVRDPVSLQYFQISEDEKQIAEEFDGSKSLKQIAQSRGLADRGQLTWLFALYQRLEGACLLQPTGPHTGHRLSKAREQLRHNSLWLQAINPLSIRVRLFDPSRLLDCLAPLERVLFSVWFLAAWLTATTVIGLLIVNQLLSRTSWNDPLEGLTGVRVAGMFLIFAVVKSLHELGHALACKRWNAPCHELGLMFLVFAPCLYCDTSDSWKLSNRWQRASIAVAGIYIELIIATLCGLVWLLSRNDSPLQWWAWNTLLLCSLNTLLINGSPLLRYDGYYAFSDILGVPNLADQSREAMHLSTAAWLTASPIPVFRWDASPIFLLSYAVIAFVYRSIVTILVGIAVWKMMEHVGLPLIGMALVALTLGLTLFSWLQGIIRRVGEFTLWDRVRPLRATSVAIVLVGLAYWLGCQSWPTFAYARAIAHYAELTPVYASHAGILSEIETAGREVALGQMIARIESIEIDLQVIDSLGHVQSLEQRLAQLKLRLVDDNKAAADLLELQEQIAKARQQHELLRIEQENLRIEAPNDGTLLAADPVATLSLCDLDDQSNRRPLLSTANVGRRVERGDLVGWIGRPQAILLICYLPEHEATRIAPGMVVRCRWDCDASQLYLGTVRKVTPDPITEVPTVLIGDQSIPHRIDGSGKAVPLYPCYAAEIEVDQWPATTSHSSLVSVHIETASQTLPQIVKRWLDIHVRPEL